jgi:hypothetical protein
MSLLPPIFFAAFDVLISDGYVFDPGGIGVPWWGAPRAVAAAAPAAMTLATATARTFMVENNAKDLRGRLMSIAQTSPSPALFAQDPPCARARRCVRRATFIDPFDGGGIAPLAQ